MTAYQDPLHPGNAASHHTGQPCIEPGCTAPAGTAWSPLWCHACNVKRMDRIGQSLSRITRQQSSIDAVLRTVRQARGSVRVPPSEGGIAGPTE